MNGPERYMHAGQTIADAKRHITEDPRDMRIAEVTALVGIGEAILALAAATALGTAKDDDLNTARGAEWRAVAG